MTDPTPRSAAPANVRRLELVGELMASLDGVEELPLDAPVELELVVEASAASF